MGGRPIVPAQGGIDYEDLTAMSATHSKTDVVGLSQHVPVLVAGRTSLIGPRVGRVET